MLKNVFITFTSSVLVLLIMASWVLLWPRQGLACTVYCTGTEFGIATDPPNSFLKMDRMAPGDRVTASLTVKNTGQLDFSYKITAALQPRGGYRRRHIRAPGNQQPVQVENWLFSAY